MSRPDPLPFPRYSSPVLKGLSDTQYNTSKGFHPWTQIVEIFQKFPLTCQSRSVIHKRNKTLSPVWQQKGKCGLVIETYFLGEFVGLEWDKNKDTNNPGLTIVFPVQVCRKSLYVEDLIRWRSLTPFRQKADGWQLPRCRVVQHKQGSNYQKLCCDGETVGREGVLSQVPLKKIPFCVWADLCHGNFARGWDIS